MITFEEKEQISREIAKKMLDNIKNMKAEEFKYLDSIVFHRSWYDENLEVKK